MADRVTVSNSSASSNTDFIVLTDEVTDATLGQGQKQLVGIMDATINGTDKLIITSSGAAKVDPSGVTSPVSVTSVPAAARTTDSVAAGLQVDKLMNNLTAVTPVSIVIDHAVSGDNTLVSAAGVNNIILVHQLFLVAASAVTVRFESGTGGTALTGQMQLAANTGFVLPFSPVGWFKTATNTLLNLELSGAVSVDGSLSYTVVT